MFPKEHNELELETIFRLCHNLRKNGKRIVFTHGVFDLFHYAHLNQLRKSKKMGDVLIVALDSDVNARTAKTIQRPVIDQTRRLEIISELNCVDLAFINQQPLTDDTYNYLYREIGPSLLTIGKDFGFEENIIRRAQKHTIQLLKFPNNEETTTDIIQRIQKNQPTRSHHIQSHQGIEYIRLA